MSGPRRRWAPGAACTSPLFHSLHLASHSGILGSVFDDTYMAPFKNWDRESVMPGASFHTTVLESRAKAIRKRYRPIVGPSEQARFQVIPAVLATYCGVVSTLESSRRTARVSFSRAGSQAQEVVSVPTGYKNGIREYGFEFQAANKLPPLAIQAGRLFRYQRLTPVELTYSGQAADANWAYERSSVWVKPRCENHVESMMLSWVACSSYATTFRQHATLPDAEDGNDDDDDDP